MSTQRLPPKPGDAKPTTVEELAERLSREHPHADLKFLVEGLERSLGAYPDDAKQSRRRLMHHVQATPCTVKLLRDLAEALCR